MLLLFSNDETLKFEKFVLKVLRKFVCNFGPIFLGKKCDVAHGNVLSQQRMHYVGSRGRGVK